MHRSAHLFVAVFLGLSFGVTLHGHAASERGPVLEAASAPSHAAGAPCALCGVSSARAAAPVAAGGAIAAPPRRAEPAPPRPLVPGAALRGRLAARAPPRAS